MSGKLICQLIEKKISTVFGTKNECQQQPLVYASNNHPIAPLCYFGDEGMGAAVIGKEKQGLERLRLAIPWFSQHIFVL